MSPATKRADTVSFGFRAGHGVCLPTRSIVHFTLPRLVLLYVFLFFLLKVVRKLFRSCWTEYAGVDCWLHLVYHSTSHYGFYRPVASVYTNAVDYGF